MLWIGEARLGCGWVMLWVGEARLGCRWMMLNITHSDHSVHRATAGPIASTQLTRWGSPSP